jgi:hypothetical protein
VNIKCNVVAIAFANGPVNFSSTEKSADVESAVFTAIETTNVCGYPFTYSYSVFPSWVTYNMTTRRFKINSLNENTGATRTATITMTATATLPEGYVGPTPVTVSMSITATLNACSVNALAFATNILNF